MNDLDKFGKLVTTELRDSVLNRYLDIESGFIGSDIATQLHKKLNLLSEDQKKLIRHVLTDTIDSGIHDFLFAIQESKDIKVLANDKNVVELSDGLNGEIFSEDGWFEIYSQHNAKGI